ncbi:MAG: low molecular weight phosphotyrosine protein phosphatase [Akkermansiaceae bacterium]|nr:low molecular weight phosphotyrosine protein phosphatase [Akkermansiaceae bacterium]
MPRTPFNVIFVCMGNICRSPAAENILRHQVKQAGLEEVINIDSAGTHDYHPGKPPDIRMCKTLRNRDIPVAGKARRFTAQDLLDFDLILTMDNDNYQRVIALAGSPEYERKVRKFTTFCVDPDHQLPEVPDPYYGSGSGFELVADMLEDGCAQLLEYVRKQMESGAR